MDRSLAMLATMGGRRAVWRWLVAAFAAGVVIGAPADVAVAAPLTPRTGDYPAATFVSEQLTDHTTLGVNVANGNLLVSASDLEIRGTGLDLLVGRAYNSLSSVSGAVGSRWNMSTGQDVRFFEELDGSVTLYGSSGTVLSFTRRADGTFVSPLGLHVTLTFVSAAAGFELADDLSGEISTFTSSGPGTFGRLTSQRDRYNNKITFAYDNGGRLLSMTDTRGRVVNVTPGGSGQIAALTDATGRSVQYRYGSSNRLSSVTDTGGKSTAYGYDGSGRLSSITTAAGRVTKVNYDARGWVASIVRTTDAAHTSGPTTTFAFGSGAPCATGESRAVVSDPDAATATGHTTTYCSDGSDRVVSVTDSSGAKTSLTYASTGDVSAVKRPRGGVTNYGFDDAARDLLCIQRGVSIVQSCQTATGGLKTTLAYANTDALTRHLATTLTDASRHSTLFCYNGSTPACGSPSGPAGSLQSTSNQLVAQSVRRYSYNAKGNPTVATDATGIPTTYGYDAAGDNLISATPNSLGVGNHSVTYDALTRPRTVTDGKGHTATYGYDALDRLTSVAYAPGGPTVSYAYNADGDLTTLTDPSGVTTYVVDQLGRLTAENFPGGTSNAYTYDAADNLKSVTDDGGTTSYAYNGLNQLTAVSEPGATQATTFTYDADGQRTQIKYPSGVSVNTSYDPFTGNITSVSNQGPAGNVLKSFSLFYTSAVANGDLPRFVLDEAQNTTVYTYDALNRVTSTSTNGPNPSRFRYDLDGEGRFTFVTSSNSLEITQGITEAEEYSRDSAGLICGRFFSNWPKNLTPIPTGGPCHAPDSPTSPDGTPSIHRTLDFHDVNGNDVNTLGQQYTYNSADQPTSVGVWTLGGAPQQLAYRGAGQSQLIRDGALTIQNNSLGISARGQTHYARATDGTLLTERTPSGAFNYLYDATGSVIALANSTGTVTTRYTYDAYGHPDNDTSNGNENPFASEGVYSLGVGGSGVVCKASQQTDEGPIEASDGLRLTQPYGVWPYKTLTSDLKGTGLQAHHLIEKRFADLLGQSPRDMASVAVTKAEHQVFTNAWRRVIPYGDGTLEATRAEVEATAGRIYANHPEIRRALGLP
jgi:YD repeat-containing protein